MKAACLLSTVLLIAIADAHRSILASSTDKYGIVTAVNSGNSTGAVNGFVTAGQSTDTAGIVAALAQIFGNSSITDSTLVQTAAALSQAAIRAPALYNTLANAFVQAVLGQFTLDTTASIRTATTALGAMRLAQQPYIVQLVFQNAFTSGLAPEAAVSTGTAERLGGGTCNNGTFLAAQYALALGSVIDTNQTAAGLALAAAHDINLAGCVVATATGIPLVTAGCSQNALKTLATAQTALNATTGDKTALATSIATFSPSNDTLTCLAQAQILYSGEDSTAQSAAMESYNTVLSQAVSGAGANNSFRVAGAGESLYEAVEKGPTTGSGMSSLSGLAALAQTTSCNYIYPVLIQSAQYMSPALFNQSVSQSAALSACYALGMSSGAVVPTTAVGT